VSELDHPNTDVGGVEHGVGALAQAGRFVVAFRERHEHHNATPPATGWPGPGLYARQVGVGTAPNTTITAHPQEGHRSPNGSIAFTSSLSASSFACRRLGTNSSWEEWPWQQCTSPLQITGMVSQGWYGWEVRASSGGWTDATPARAAWKNGDFAAPVVDLQARVPRLTTARIARFMFTTYESDATMACSVDGGPRFDCTSGRLTLTAVALGDHQLRIWATDALGNAQQVPTTWTWTVFSIDEASGRTADQPPVSSASRVVVPGVAGRAQSRPAAVAKRRAAVSRRRARGFRRLGIGAQRQAARRYGDLRRRKQR
jgi:hypothetical protein